MQKNLAAIKLAVVFIATAILCAVPAFAGAAAPDNACDTDGVVIDSHLHVTSSENWDSSPLKATGMVADPPTGEKALEVLNGSSVDMAVLVSTAYLFPDREKAMHENDYVAGLVKAHPDKFRGLCAIPASQAWALEELERCVNVLGLNGLKLHLHADPMNLTRKEDAVTIAAVLKKAAELQKGLPVLIDFNWMDDAQTTAMLEMAMANPDVNIIMAHALGHHYKELVMVGLLRKLIKGGLDNLYADISATLSTYTPDAPSFDDYIWHLRQLGSARLLFGSDYPVETPGSAYDHFLKMGFHPEEQKQIQGENAARLFGCTQANSG